MDVERGKRPEARGKKLYSSTSGVFGSLWLALAWGAKTWHPLAASTPEDTVDFVQLQCQNRSQAYHVTESPVLTRQTMCGDLERRQRTGVLTTPVIPVQCRPTGARVEYHALLQFYIWRPTHNTASLHNSRIETASRSISLPIELIVEACCSCRRLCLSGLAVLVPLGVLALI